MAKRLRSLASILWDSEYEPDGPEQLVPCQEIKQLQAENAKLREQLVTLQREVSILKTPTPLQTVRPGLRTSSSDLSKAWPNQSWVRNVREDVSRLLRLSEEILPDLEQTQDAKGRILFDLPRFSKASASTVLRHAEGCVRSLFAKHPAVFKIGISSNPVKRWNHPRYGYAHDTRENWLGMKVLAACETSFCAGMLESALIQTFQGTPGCRNDRPGGETPSPDEGPHFTYVVYRILLPPLKVVSRATAAI